MIRKGSLLGEILEQGGSIVKQTGKQVVKVPSDLAKTVATQTGGQPTSADQNAPATSDVAPADATASKKQQEEFVKGLYGGDVPQISSDEIRQKKLDEEREKAKLREELRQKRHQEVYYQPLVNPPKPKEERPAEKVEREKMEELQEVQEKEEKKPPPLPPSARRGTVERKLGISG